MDAETRHELKTNSLYDTLLKAREWLDKWLNAILIIITIVFLSIAGWRWWSARQQAAVDEAWGVIAETRVEGVEDGEQPLEELRAIIAGNIDPAVVAVARIRLADGLLYRVSGAEGAGKLNDAVEALKSVVDAPSVSPLIRAAALFRLATVYETQRDFSGAKAAYERLSTDAAFADSPYRTDIDKRIASLADLPKSVEFLPGTAPVVAPTIPQPTTTSAPTSAPTSSPVNNGAATETPPPASAPAEPAPASQPGGASGSGN